MNTPTAISSDALVERYLSIWRERMQALPFVNQALNVEAIGFCPFNEHQLGVLIAPWFMNLVILLKAGIGSTFPAGSKITVRLPSGPIEFTAACDDELGTFLSAVLFSSVGDIPDQTTARDIAQEVMREVFNTAHIERTIRRRALFSHSETADA